MCQRHGWGARSGLVWLVRARPGPVGTQTPPVTDVEFENVAPSDSTRRGFEHGKQPPGLLYTWMRGSSGGCLALSSSSSLVSALLLECFPLLVPSRTVQPVRLNRQTNKRKSNIRKAIARRGTEQPKQARNPQKEGEKVSSQPWRYAETHKRTLVPELNQR